MLTPTRVIMRGVAIALAMVLATTALGGPKGKGGKGGANTTPLEVEIRGTGGIQADGLGSYTDSVFGGGGEDPLVRATQGSDLINFDSAFPPKKKNQDPGLRRVFWNFGSPDGYPGNTEIPGGGVLADLTGDPMDTGLGVRKDAELYIGMVEGETMSGTLAGFLIPDSRPELTVAFRFDAIQEYGADIPFGCPPIADGATDINISKIPGTPETWEITSDGDSSTACVQVINSETGEESDAIEVTFDAVWIWFQHHVQ